MIKRLLAALTAFSLLASIPAHADYAIKDGNAASQTFGSFSLSGVQFPKHVMVDPTTGAAIGVSGAPLFMSLAGTTVPLPTGAATATAQATSNASLASIAAASGNPNDAAWDGAASSASQVGILKALWNKLAGLLTVDTVVRSTSTDRGGTVTAGGTAQQFMAANTVRRGFVLQNQSTGDLYVNCVATAAANQTSLKIPAGALYDTPPHHAGTGACSIFGATTGQAFYAREF